MEVWNVTVFTKNRPRLLEGKIAEGFFDTVLAQAEAQPLLSPEHFMVDGTLIEAGATVGAFGKSKIHWRKAAARVAGKCCGTSPG